MRERNGLKRWAVIMGSGSYIPTRKISNDDFIDHVFYGPDGKKLEKSNEQLIHKFREITGIEERRYITDDLVTSDIAFLAAKDAIATAQIDSETLDYIIVAHNFGDVRKDNRRSEFVPSIASRVKHYLGIKNPGCIPYDLPFGCAGWLQAVIQANNLIQSGNAGRILVVGAETLSRISDPHDRDSMIYADGAGAIILEARESDEPIGILSSHTESYTAELAYTLYMDKSFNPNFPGNDLFLKMKGSKLYEHVLKIVPSVIKESVDKAGMDVYTVDKILIHQANKKMVTAILKRFYELYHIPRIPNNIMPLIISRLGNSSVATLPTLYDLLCKGELKNHEMKEGNIVVFAAVGAGVNVNSLVYKVPVFHPNE